MSVHYKFKSCNEFDTLPVDGMHISLGDLKDAIIEQKKLGRGQPFDLQVTNAETKEVYKDDKVLIAKNSSLLVARVPIDPSQMKKPWEINKDATALLLSNPANLMNTEDAAEAALVDRKIRDVTDLSKLEATEEDKINVMMAQSTLEYHPSRYVKLRNSNMSGTVPPGYKCYKCHQSWHWVSMCPLNNQDLRKSSGIPTKFLVEVDDVNTPGVMITPGGKFVVFRNDAVSDAKNIGGKPIENVPPPPELICPLCSEILKNAVIVPCCTTAYCDECITNHLLASDKHTCPSCTEDDVAPDAVIPSRYLRLKCFQFENQMFSSLMPVPLGEGVSSPAQPSSTKSDPPTSALKPQHSPLQLVDSQEEAAPASLNQVNDVSLSPVGNRGKTSPLELSPVLSPDESVHSSVIKDVLGSESESQMVYEGSLEDRHSDEDEPGHKSRRHHHSSKRKRKKQKHSDESQEKRHSRGSKDVAEGESDDAAKEEHEEKTDNATSNSTPAGSPEKEVNSSADVPYDSAIATFNPNVPPPSAAGFSPLKDGYHHQTHSGSYSGASGSISHYPYASRYRDTYSSYSYGHGTEHTYPDVSKYKMGDDPLASFQNYLREKDMKRRHERRSPHYRARSRSRPRSYTRSRTRSPSDTRLGPSGKSRLSSRSPARQRRRQSRSWSRESGTRVHKHSHYHSPHLDRSPSLSSRSPSPRDVSPLYANLPSPKKDFPASREFKGYPKYDGDYSVHNSRWEQARFDRKGEYPNYAGRLAPYDERARTDPKPHPGQEIDMRMYLERVRSRQGLLQGDRQYDYRNGTLKRFRDEPLRASYEEPPIKREIEVRSLREVHAEGSRKHHLKGTRQDYQDLSRQQQIRHRDNSSRDRSPLREGGTRSRRRDKDDYRSKDPYPQSGGSFDSPYKSGSPYPDKNYEGKKVREVKYKLEDESGRAKDRRPKEAASKDASGRSSEYWPEHPWDGSGERRKAPRRSDERAEMKKLLVTATTSADQDAKGEKRKAHFRDADVKEKKEKKKGRDKKKKKKEKRRNSAISTEGSHADEEDERKHKKKKDKKRKKTKDTPEKEVVPTPVPEPVVDLPTVSEEVKVDSPQNPEPLVELPPSPNPLLPALSKWEMEDEVAPPAGKASEDARPSQDKEKVTMDVIKRAENTIFHNSFRGRLLAGKRLAPDPLLRPREPAAGGDHADIREAKSRGKSIQITISSKSEAQIGKQKAPRNPSLEKDAVDPSACSIDLTKDRDSFGEQAPSSVLQDSSDKVDVALDDVATCGPEGAESFEPKTSPDPAEIRGAESCKDELDPTVRSPSEGGSGVLEILAETSKSCELEDGEVSPLHEAFLFESTQKDLQEAKDVSPKADPSVGPADPLQEGLGMAEGGFLPLDISELPPPVIPPEVREKGEPASRATSAESKKKRKKSKEKSKKKKRKRSSSVSSASSSTSSGSSSADEASLRRKHKHKRKRTRSTESSDEDPHKQKKKKEKKKKRKKDKKKKSRKN